MATEPTRRPYSSPLRESQAGRTRDLILDALTALLADRRVDEVSTKEIAARAGVSQPTVYRHFPDRAALVEGLADRIAAQMMGGFPPTTLEEWVASGTRGFVLSDEHAVEATAEAVLNADPRRYTRATRARTERLKQAVADALPELDAQQQLQVAALFRVILSGQTWLRMREEFGLAGTESGPVVQWAMRTLIREIREGNYGAE